MGISSIRPNGKLYLVNRLFPFQVFSLALSIERNASAFPLFLTFSTSMNLGETVTYCGLAGMSLYGSVPYRLRVPNAFGGGGWI